MSKYTLNQLADKVRDESPTINLGGCCVFAALVAKQLQHHYPTRIIVFNPNAVYSIDEVRPKVKKNNCEEWDKNGMDFYHVAIEFTDEDGTKFHYDANGVFPDDGSIDTDLLQVKGYLTIQEACELASNNEGWSSRFDRNNIPKIDKIIKKHFGVSVDNRWSTKSILRTSNNIMDDYIKEYYHSQLILS
jgi:hypothetical protein